MPLVRIRKMPILKASLDRRDTAHNVPAIGTMEEIQARLKSRYPALSARELQLAAWVKAGMSARRIAAELGLPRRPSSLTATASMHGLGWRGAVVQQSKYRPQQPFEQFALRSDARQDSNAEKDAQKGFGKIFGRMGLRDASVPLAIANASKEELLYFGKKNGDNIKEFVVVRSAFDGRVHQHAAAALLVGEGAFDDFLQKRDNGFAWRKAWFQPTNPLAKRLIEISV